MEADDEKLYLRVARELSANVRDEGLWTKAFALENGDEAKTKAHYIRLRVEQLKRSTSEPAASGKIAADKERPSLELTEKTEDEGDTSKLMSLAIGSNSNYYLEKHQQMRDSRKTASWNWAAFLFTIPWALYRKLWVQGVLGVIIGSLISGVFRFIPAVEVLLLLAFSAVYGLLGNSWVIARATKLTSSESRSGKDRHEIFAAVSDRGGTSLFPLVIVFCLLVVGMLAGQSLVSYSKYKEAKSNLLDPVPTNTQPGQRVETQAIWIPLGEDTKNRAEYYLSSPLPNRVGSLVRPQILISVAQSSAEDFKRDDVNYRSGILNYEINCDSKQIRTLSSTLFSERMGNGRKLKSEESTREWMPVTNGTLGGQVFPFACGPQ